MFYIDKLLRDKHLIYMKILVNLIYFSKMTTGIFFSSEKLLGLLYGELESKTKRIQWL